MNSKIFFTTLLLLIFSLIYHQKLKGQDTVMWWSFDKIDNNKLKDEISNLEDTLLGYRQLVSGVVGNSLRLDGYTTRVVRRSTEVPAFVNGFTVEAWIALQALPWNWSAIVSQGIKKKDNSQLISADKPTESMHVNSTLALDAHYDHKIFFGVDAHGHVGFKLNINGHPYNCISEEKLPLLKWSHVAATFNPGEGMKVFINGELVSELEVQGTIIANPGTDLLLGMNIQELGPVGSERQASADIQSRMVIHGLLDEVKIYDHALPTDFIKESYLTNKSSEMQHLAWNRMPSGPEQLPKRFDGYYTRLHYTDEWEAPRRESDHSDILIHFDQLPVRLIFWRGTNYGASWVTENGLWMGDQSVERAGAGKSPMGCSEHMSDKQLRYGNVKIIEKNDARIVVKWRYAIADILYDIFGSNTDSGWGEWAEEYYYIYPDGVSTRHQRLWSEHLSHEFQETIVLNHPGTAPEDNIELEALTLVNMDGEYKTWSWKDDINQMKEMRSKGGFTEPQNPNIQMVNLRSAYKPFIIFEPNPKIVPFNPNTIRPEYSHFPWWNHWPVAQIPNDGRRAFAPDRASHSSLSQSLEGSEVIHDNGDGTFEVFTLTGMTNKPATSLVALAKSWNYPPHLALYSDGFTEKGFSKKERAFLISSKNEDTATELKFSVHASQESPVVNPCFVIEGWGDAEVQLTVNDQKIHRGDSFRYGFRRTMHGIDLIVWMELTSVNPVRISINKI